MAAKKTRIEGASASNGILAGPSSPTADAIEQGAAHQRDSHSQQVRCYFAFGEPGAARQADDLPFLGLWNDARAWILQQKRSKQKTQERDLARRQRAFAKTEVEKLWDLVAEVVKSEVARDPAKLAPEWLEKHRAKLEELGVFDIVSHETEVLRLELALAKEAEVDRAFEAAMGSTRTLWEKAGEGDATAAGHLLELCRFSVAFLERIYKQQPELLHEKTAYARELPVLARLDPRWMQKAASHMKRVKLGAKVAEGRFKDVAYRDEAYVCRRWAREAVGCLDRNRYAPVMLQDILEYLQSGDSEGLVLAKFPDWLMDAIKLPPFEKASAKAWGSVARKLIREECPDFDQHSDFKSLLPGIARRRVEAPGVKSRRRGTHQNALLDKIVEAIETIAAEEQP